PQSADISPARKGAAKEDLFFRKQASGSARLRWVWEYSKHRRTATRQRGFRSSCSKQIPANTSQPRVPLEDDALKVIREVISLRAPAQSAETPQFRVAGILCQSAIQPAIGIARVDGNVPR